jgi:hypothetical protein
LQIQKVGAVAHALRTALDAKKNRECGKNLLHRDRRKKTAVRSIGRWQDLPLSLPPVLQLLNPLLKALHHEREPLVTKLMGVAETR